MKFTDDQIALLLLRLRQTKEELLYCPRLHEVQRYDLAENCGSILGVAHCDYVEDAWSYPERSIFDGDDIVTAGQVDDRVGVWLLLDVLPEIPGMPVFDVLLTTDEEIGRSSASEVDEDLVYNWTFQFDRRGTDFVDYGLASAKFLRQFKATTKIAHGIGSFSDICSLPDSCGSRVNIGTAYYGEHRPNAYVNLNELAIQVEMFVKFAGKFAGKQFPARQPKRRRMVRSYKPLDDNWDGWIPKSSAGDALKDIDDDFDCSPVA